MKSGDHHALISFPNGLPLTFYHLLVMRSPPKSPLVVKSIPHFPESLKRGGVYIIWDCYHLVHRVKMGQNLQNLANFWKNFENFSKM